MLTGVNEIDQETLMQMLMFSAKNGRNLLTFGPAGTGKTEMAMQACTAVGAEYVYLNLSVLESPDLMGLPMIDEATKTTVYATPRMLPVKENRTGGSKPLVLLVDELDKAKPELQNPMLELFQFRSMNGRPIDISAVIATGNLPDEHAFSQAVSHALTNRCMTFRVVPSFEPWQQWAAGAGVNPLVVGYLSREQNMLLQPPPEGDETAYCHPSPRAWTNAARALDEADGADVNFQTLLVSGYVGTAAAIKFKVWLEHYRHIAPLIDALVKDGKTPPEGLTMDRQMVCALSAMGAVMDKCRSKPGSGEKAARFEQELEKVVHNVFEWVKLLPADFAIMATKSVLTTDMINQHKLVRFKPFMETFLKIRGALDPKGSVK